MFALLGEYHRMQFARVSLALDEINARMKSRQARGDFARPYCCENLNGDPDMKKKEIEGKIFDALDRLSMGAHEGVVKIGFNSMKRFSEELAEVISAASEQRDLRDHFAGQALVALGNWIPKFHTPEEIRSARAAWAYAQADAMIAERSK